MSRRVLVVDDNATIRMLSGKVLAGMGLTPVDACDGEAGLALAEKERFELVLADVNMPKMDGIEMIRRIRKIPGYQRTPILIISTENTPEIMQRGKEAGANGWLVKPFQRERLLALLEKLVSR